VHHGVVAAIAGDGDDLGFTGHAVLRVLDTVGFGGVVRSKLGGADDDLEVGGLVQTLGFAGIEAGDDGFDLDVGVCASDRAGGRVVGAGCSGFDVRDVWPQSARTEVGIGANVVSIRPISTSEQADGVIGGATHAIRA
jgi:hypothetical protein